MGRLIDANELKKAIISQIVLGGTMAKAVDRYLHLVDSQPTAFDVDKVTEQLEELGKFPCGTSGKCIHAYDDFYEKHGGCEKCVAFRAIEIVKGGGVDGN